MLSYVEKAKKKLPDIEAVKKELLSDDHVSTDNRNHLNSNASARIWTFNNQFYNGEERDTYKKYQEHYSRLKKGYRDQSIDTTDQRSKSTSELPVRYEAKKTRNGTSYSMIDRSNHDERIVSNKVKILPPLQKDGATDSEGSSSSMLLPLEVLVEQKTEERCSSSREKNTPAASMSTPMLMEVLRNSIELLKSIKTDHLDNNSLIKDRTDVISNSQGQFNETIARRSSHDSNCVDEACLERNNIDLTNYEKSEDKEMQSKMLDINIPSI